AVGVVGPRVASALAADDRQGGVHPLCREVARHQAAPTLDRRRERPPADRVGDRGGGGRGGRGCRRGGGRRGGGRGRRGRRGPGGIIGAGGHRVRVLLAFGLSPLLFLPRLRQLHGIQGRPVLGVRLTGLGGAARQLGVGLGQESLEVSGLLVHLSLDLGHLRLLL